MTTWRVSAGRVLLLALAASAIAASVPSLAGAQGAPQAAPAASAPAPWKFTLIGSERLRAENWTWFTPAVAFDPSYSILSSVLRIGALAQSRRWDAQLELAQPWLISQPDSALVVAPAPQGQLGFAGSYRAANGGQQTGVFVKQGFVRLKAGTPGHTRTLRAGRFEYGDGRETTPLNATLAQLKRDRLVERLIGSFAFPAAGRSFDGVEGMAAIAGGTGALFAARPTQGVFNLDGMPELDVDLAYASFTRPIFGEERAGTSAARGEVRLFAQFYDDRRAPGPTMVRVDNRPAAVRAADSTRIRITTVGGHYISTHKLGAGEVDLLAWVALQSGSWGRQDHSASAVALEGGYRFPLGGLRPWVRGGYYQGSGDADPADATHGTYFSAVPTPRLYARFPFYNLMNVNDVFGQVLLPVTKRVTVRSDVHRVQLAQAADLWYVGGGAFEDKSFGYAGRRSSGFRDLATLVDLSADLALRPKTTISLYAARALGGDVVKALYPLGGNATYLHLELVQRF